MAKRKQSQGAADLMTGLRELAQCIRDGVRPEDRFTARTITFPPPSAFPPAAVKKLRGSLGVSQAAFADMLGVSRILAQSWERGVREPSHLARRLLDTIAADPVGWLSMVQRVHQRSGKRAG